MKIGRIWIQIALFSLPLFLSSCATEGTAFNLQGSDKLQLGKTQPAEVVALFGTPLKKWTKTTAVGSYSAFEYDYFKAAFGGHVNAKIIILEFKEGKLNGYFYASSFREDKTEVDMNNLDKLKAGVAKLTKNDVLELLGKPSGESLCPSMLLADFKDKCEKNTEVWGWYMSDQVNLFNPDNTKSTEVFVSFDASGKVSSVEVSAVAMDKLNT